MAEDGSYVDTLLSHYRDTLFHNPNKVKQKFLETRIKVRDSIDYYKLTLFAGYACFHNNQMDSALLLNEKVIQFCKQNPSNRPRLAELKAFAYNHRGVFLQEMNKRDSAVIYLKLAYDALYQAKDRTELPDICINLADNYMQLGNFPLATSYYRKALAATDSLDMKTEIHPAIYCGLAKIYLDLNNFELSDHYFKLAEKYYKGMSPYEQFHFANTRGNYYYTTKEYRKALGWFIKANKSIKAFKQRSYEAITEANMGEIYLLLNKTDSAQYYLDKANTFFCTANADGAISFYINGLYAALALQKNELENANKLLSKHYDLSQINPSYIYLYNKRLESYYEKKGNFQQAYFYRKKVDIYDDSLRNIKTLNNIAEIDSRYSQDTTLLKRDIIISKSKAEVQKLRITSLFSISLFLAGVIIVIILIYSARRKRELRYAQQMATMTKLRMENVRNRISPHYLFNVLNAVIPSFKQYDDLAHPLKLLIQSLRNNLIASEKIAIPLEDEIDLVKNYIELRKSTGSIHTETYWHISPGTLLSTLIPSMIIQIPVENSIKYAFEEEQTDAHINIDISTDNFFLYIIIEDNGTGYNPGDHVNNERSTGTGLKVIFRTVELLNLRNQEKMAFSIQNLKQLSQDMHGTRVTIIVPLKYNYNL